MRRRRELALFALAIALSACDTKQLNLNAIGSYSDVAILTSSALLPVATMLERELEIDVEYALKPEHLLEADIFDIRDRKGAEVYKNVIVLGLIAGKDASSRELRRQLAGESMRALAARQLFLATRKDTYARNQNVLFLAGQDRDLMQDALREQAPALRGQIEESNRERLREYLFARGHNVAVEQKVREMGGFRLSVPADWEATRFFAGQEAGSIEVAATSPTRTLAILWIALPDSSKLSARDWLLEVRRRWGQRFLDEQLQDAGGFHWSEEMFLGEKHLMLAGSWDHQTYGGPFRTIFHYDASSRRLYGVNWLCYAPELRKHGYMREAHAIAETFRP